MSMEKVSFAHMADGTAEEYAFLVGLEEQYIADLPGRLMASLESLEESLPGYQVTRLEHSLQSAVSYTHLRAHETDSYLVCRLLL